MKQMNSWWLIKKVQSRIKCLSSQGQNVSLKSEMLCLSLVFITKVNYNLSLLWFFPLSLHTRTMDITTLKNFIKKITLSKLYPLATSVKLISSMRLQISSRTNNLSQRIKLKGLRMSDLALREINANFTVLLEKKLMRSNRKRILS